MKKKLKKYLKNKLIIDIFLIGSSVKNKIEPKDIDIVVLFREENFEKSSEIIYNIKEHLEIENIHIEPLITDRILSEKIFLPILHEGFSMKHNKNVSELLGVKSFSLFIFSLIGLKNIDKVRFAQTIYGRKGNGLLMQEGGRSLGKGSFIISINKEHLFREVMVKFKTKFEVKRIFVKD